MIKLKMNLKFLVILKLFLVQINYEFYSMSWYEQNFKIHHFLQNSQGTYHLPPVEPNK